MSIAIDVIHVHQMICLMLYIIILFHGESTKLLLLLLLLLSVVVVVVILLGPMPFELFQLKYLGCHLWHVCHYSETSILYAHVCYFPATVVHLFQSQEAAHTNSELLCTISGFCHDVEEICALLGYYVAQNGNSVLMFFQGSRSPRRMSYWTS
jgi:hypothetical protein